MKNILLFLLLLLPFISRSQTYEVSGNQDGIWDCDTILVVGDVVVAEENSLSITAGTNVIFKDHYNILVKGGFEAIGNENAQHYRQIWKKRYYTVRTQQGWNSRNLRRHTDDPVHGKRHAVLLYPICYARSIGSKPSRLYQ